MRSKTPEPIQAIRQALDLDNWGKDIYRLKNRIGQQQLEIEELTARLDRLTQAHLDSHPMRAQPTDVAIHHHSPQ